MKSEGEITVLKRVFLEIEKEIGMLIDVEIITTIKTQYSKKVRKRTKQKHVKNKYIEKLQKIKLMFLRNFYKNVIFPFKF